MTFAAILQAFAAAVEQHVAEAKATARQELVDAINGVGVPVRQVPAMKPHARPTAKTKRRKAPIQLCPAPGCKERAAPVFGMVCAGHKDMGKRVIAKWREARRAKKAKK